MGVGVFAFELWGLELVLAVWVWGLGFWVGLLFFSLLILGFEVMEIEVWGLEIGVES